MKVTLVDTAPPRIHTWPLLADLRSLKAKTMKKIDLLIQERSHIRLDARTDKYPVSYGLLCLGTVLREMGCVVTYINQSYLMSKSNWDEMWKQCVAESDIVGITCMTPSYPNAKILARQVKTKNEKGWVVLGGPHVTFDDVDALGDGVDIVVRGEGEGAIRDIADAFPNREKLRNIKGISFMDSRESVRTQDRNPIGVTEIPIPAWELLPEGLRSEIVPRIFTSRGCLYSCPYCAEKRLWGGLRVRESATVYAEVDKVLKLFGVDFIPIADSIFGVHDKQIEIVRAIRKTWSHVFFSCQARFDHLTSETMKQLAEANVVGLFLGMESGSTQVLHGMRRPLFDNTKYQTLQEAQQIFPFIYTSWIIGYPGESHSTIEETRTLIDSLHRDLLVTDTRPRVYVPYPGTEPVLDPDRIGLRIKTKDWERYTRFGFPPVFELTNLSDFDIWLGFLECFVTGLRHQVRQVGMETELDNVLTRSASEVYDIHEFDYRALV